MNKTRLEAFSDGVIAIIITIMVLEIKVPHEVSWQALQPLIPTVISYALSFIYVGIYWNNHHHMLHPVKHVSAAIMWSNHHLLFWLSLVPFATAWMGEHHFPPVPVAMYAFVMLMCGMAYDILRRMIIRAHPHDTQLRDLLTRQTTKTIISTVSYSAGIGLAFVHPFISLSLLLCVAIMWVVPDQNIEKSAEHG